MFYLLSLIWVFSIVGFFVLICRKKFGYMLTPAFVISTFIIYFFCFFNQLRIGFYCTFIFVVLFWVKIGYLLINKKREKLLEFKNNYFTSAFFVFTVLFVYTCVLFRYKGYANCDEFAHWGRMVIASIKTNGFYAQPQKFLDFHQDYPPFFTLFECLWSGFDGFVFHEWQTYIALNMFMFSCFMPMFENTNSKNKYGILKVIIGTVCVILVGLTISKTPTASDNAYVYTSIYTDWALVTFSAYTLFMIIKDKKYDKYFYALLCLNLSALLIIKQIAIYYYLLILFFVLVKIAIVDKELNLKKLLKGVVFFVVIPLCIYLSWKAVINYYNLSGQFVISNMRFSDILDIMRWDVSETWRSEAYVNFRYAILNRTLVMHPFETIYPIAAIIITILLALSTQLKKLSLFLSPIYLLGAFGYMLCIMFLYMLAFDITEAPTLASFDRYMISYLYFGIVLSLMCAFYFYSSKESIKEEIIIAIILCLFVETKTLDSLYPKLSVENSDQLKVLVVRQFGDYNFNREKLNGKTMAFDIFEFEEDLFKDSNTANTYRADEWPELIKQYDYIFIDGYDDLFYQKYWKTLNNDNSLLCYNNQLYEIEKNGTMITLSMHNRDYMDYLLRFYTLEY